MNAKEWMDRQLAIAVTIDQVEILLNMVYVELYPLFAQQARRIARVKGDHIPRAVVLSICQQEEAIRHISALKKARLS